MSHSNLLLLALFLNARIHSISCSTSTAPPPTFTLSPSLKIRASPPSAGYFVPAANGGAQLTMVEDTFPVGQGEPINVIISANSDPAVLVDQTTDGGLQNYFQALGFSTECLGQHEGDSQQANLGDGNGYLNETAVIRWDYGDPSLGTCKETIDGGNHFRYWIQNGKKADSGAIFLAVSYELPVAQGHDIIENGYNIARDELIGNATAQSNPPPTLTWGPPPGTNTNSTNATTTTTDTSSTGSPTIATWLPTYTGNTSANGYTYQTTATYLTGLLPNTSIGINHNDTVGDAETGLNAIDGLVALLQIQIVGAPPGTNLKASAALPRFTSLSLLCILSMFFTLGLSL